ncbi:CheR family methyltransferase [Crenobacter cavernae]|uniref:Chemotaxis protein methyltransferase n=1 Tax=Crenobacter cavernae TaxID=2290923 RepID=A0ABY0FIT3_9NEIS|nr:CheR family methyltransferase [Crenobacter cavernae]RXZ45083.1 chemotaxis protein CheR [Crenobacter cavernae]
MSDAETVSLERDLKFTHADFRRVRELAYQHAGIVLGEAKNHMVYARLAKRLRTLGLYRFSDYLDELVSAPQSAEWQVFVNALTTNLTAFFREPHHFDMLAEHAARHARPGQAYRVWSAASSSGEEAYSAAMVLSETLAEHRHEVWASDIDTQMLETAARGVYPLEKIEGLPPTRRQRFFLKGVGRQHGLTRVKGELAARVHFFQINLVAADWPAMGRYDAIFCRNVMIYFDKPTQAAILERLAAHLAPDGLLFLGHSENIQHLTQAFVPVGRTSYRLAGPTGS